MWDLTNTFLSFSATKPVEAAPVTSSTDPSNKSEVKDEVFLKKLKKLNESVLKFAQVRAIEFNYIFENQLLALQSLLLQPLWSVGSGRLNDTQVDGSNWACFLS